MPIQLSVTENHASMTGIDVNTSDIGQSWMKKGATIMTAKTKTLKAAQRPPSVAQQKKMAAGGQKAKKKTASKKRVIEKVHSLSNTTGYNVFN